jgi:hypothetical protein
MLMLNTFDGKKNVFLDDPSQIFRKGEIIVAKYQVRQGQKGESITIFKPERY